MIAVHTMTETVQVCRWEVVAAHTMTGTVQVCRWEDCSDSNPHHDTTTKDCTGVQVGPFQIFHPPSSRFVVVCCSTSQQHVCVSQRQDLLSYSFCHTEMEVADPTFCLIHTQYTDTGPEFGNDLCLTRSSGEDWRKDLSSMPLWRSGPNTRK